MGTFGEGIDSYLSGAEDKEKYNNLLKKYREEKFLMSKSGAGRSSWKNYDIMNQNVKDVSPKMPPILVDTSDLASLETSVQLRTSFLLVKFQKLVDLEKEKCRKMILFALKKKRKRH